jgi:2-oxoglutarate ferredoxin oxidoreductase subunit delta
MSQIVIDEARCKGCGLCTTTCLYDLVRIADRFNAKGYRPAEWVDPAGKCTGCTNCATMCPDVAIKVYRMPSRKQGRQQRPHADVAQADLAQADLGGTRRGDADPYTTATAREAG